MLSELSDKKLIFVTGKGGIGKTLCTAVLGQQLAALGKRTLIIENNYRDQVAPLFGFEPCGHSETLVSERLATINLSARETFKEYVTKHLGQPRLFDKVFNHQVVQTFIATIPGLAEVVMLGRLFHTLELAEPRRYDTIVFDGYASGHFLSLMTTPDAIIGSGIGGPLVKETSRVRQYLADPEKSTCIYVGVPESLVVSECLDFLPQLAAKSPVDLAGVVINKTPTDVLTHLKGDSGPAAAVSQPTVSQPTVSQPTVSQEATSETADQDPVGVYLDRRRHLALEAIEQLQKGLQSHAGLEHLEVCYLPDLGFIEEPVAPQIYKKLFSSSLFDQSTPSERSSAGEARQQLPNPADQTLNQGQPS